MAVDQGYEGGPVWRESVFALDNGCRMTGLGNVDLGLVLAMWGGRDGAVSDETIRQWRNGKREAPFWAYRGLWRRLRHQGFSAGELYGLLGFSFRE